ncbi:MAG: MFS transporter [Bilophila wadsworthia]
MRYSHLRGRLLVAGLRRHPAARPHEGRPRALSIVYAGVSVATIIALPVASWIGHLIGWRNVFFLGALMAAFGSSGNTAPCPLPRRAAVSGTCPPCSGAHGFWRVSAGTS